MRIAICMSGFMRDYNKSIESFFEKFYINNYDYDLFLDTYDTFDHLVDEKIDFDFLSKYNFKLIKIDKLDDLKNFFVNNKSYLNINDYKSNRYYDFLFRSVPMYYKIYSCNRMRKNYQLEYGVDYDVVIRTRPDIMFYNYIDIRTLNLNFINVDLVAGRRSFGTSRYSNYSLCNDQFCITNSENMDKYSNTFFIIKEFLENNEPAVPESIMAYNIRKEELKINTVDFNFNRDVEWEKTKKRNI